MRRCGTLRSIRPFPTSVILGLTVFALACDSDGPVFPALPAADPEIVGVIEAVDTWGSPHFDATILVGEVEVPDYREGSWCEPVCRKLWLHMRVDKAPIFIEEPSRSFLRRGGIDDLVKGAAIRAWTTGVELRSLPPQYFATRIEVVIPRADGDGT